VEAAPHPAPRPLAQPRFEGGIPVTRVLVTGGAGFIGVHLTKALLAAHDVVCLDNFTAGSRDAVRPFQGNKRYALVEADVLDPKALGKALTGVRQVYHLAANPEVRSGEQNPGVHFEQNVVATQRVLEAMRERGVKDLVFTSTSTVYGVATKMPTPEDYGPMLPISIYGSSKLAAEAVISSYAATFGMRALCFRLANVVGPGSTHGVVFDFVRKLKANPRALEVLGDGSQTKSYVHVEDAVNGMVLAATRHFDEARDRYCEVYNLGSDDKIPVSGIVRLVVEEMKLDPPPEINHTAKAVHGGGWVGDVPTMLLDSSRLKGIGWRSKRGSREALRDTVRSMLSGA
jgi:UDP-glucose 4-epimerase